MKLQPCKNQNCTNWREYEYSKGKHDQPLLSCYIGKLRYFSSSIPSFCAQCKHFEPWDLFWIKEKD